MTKTGLKGLVANSMLVALVGGCVALGGTAKAQAQQFYAGVQVGQPYYGNDGGYAAYPYYGGGYGAPGYYDHEREEHLEHERHEAWERQQAYWQHEHWEHERWEHGRRFGDDDDDRGYGYGYGYGR